MIESNVPPWFDRVGGVAWRIVAIAVAVAILIAGTVALTSIIVPVVLGLLFACGLHPLSERLRRRGFHRGLAAGLPVLALMFAAGMVAWLVVVTVVDQWDDITALVSRGRTTLEDAATDAGLEPSTSTELSADIGSATATTLRSLLEGLVHLVPTVASIGTSLLLGFVAGFFFLRDGASMWEWFVARVGGASGLTDRIGRRSWSTLSGYLRAQTVIAAIDAAGIFLGALVVGAPQPAAILMITFLAAFVPFIGAFLSGLVAVLLVLGDSGLGPGLVMLAVVLVVQVVEGNVLQPWIQGRAVTLHPLVIALSVTAGGAIAGFLGVLLAVPVTAAGVVAISQLRAAGVLGSGPAAAMEPGDATTTP